MVDDTGPFDLRSWLGASLVLAGAVTVVSGLGVSLVTGAGVRLPPLGWVGFVVAVVGGILLVTSRVSGLSVR